MKRVTKLLRNGILLLISSLLLCGFVSAADEKTVPSAAVFGDADGDGELTVQDASCITRHLTGFKLLDAAGLSRADYDGDGFVTELDASLILNSFAAPEFSVPVTKSFSMLFTSDMRGYAWDPAETEEGGACTVMNVAACAAALREANPNLYRIDAGGSLLGSSIADDYAQKTDKMYGPVTALFVKMQYDAVLLGDEAMSYPSQTVRKEVNELLLKKIPVIGANLWKADPTVFDPSDALWNDLVPYVIFESPQGEGKDPMKIAVIGMTQPDLCPSDDEVLPADPLIVYSKLRKALKDKVDYTVLVYHGNIESDALGDGVYSLRDLLKKTDSIDLVIAAHGEGESVRSERNASGVEIPIVSLRGGTETLTAVSVSLREKGRPAVLVEQIDTRDSVPDDTIRKAVKPYVSAFSGLMDGVVCNVEGRVDAFEPNALGSTDCMEITHEMQIYAARKYIEENGLDMPHEILSVAYSYLPMGARREGPLRYRELFVLKPETPQYTLMLIRGSELRAWLSAYSGSVLTEKTVYSLYGLSYLMNTLNPDTPIGFLEHSSGKDVEDDEVFTLILAEKPDEELLLRPYLDEEWLSLEDRVIAGITLPQPVGFESIKDNPVVNALVAYLENARTLKLKHLYRWVII